MKTTAVSDSALKTSGRVKKREAYAEAEDVARWARFPDAGLFGAGGEQ